MGEVLRNGCGGLGRGGRGPGGRATAPAMGRRRAPGRRGAGGRRSKEGGIRIHGCPLCCSGVRNRPPVGPSSRRISTASTPILESRDGKPASHHVLAVVGILGILFSLQQVPGRGHGAAGVDVGGGGGASEPVGQGPRSEAFDGRFDSPPPRNGSPSNPICKQTAPLSNHLKKTRYDMHLQATPAYKKPPAVITSATIQQRVTGG